LFKDTQKRILEPRIPYSNLYYFCHMYKQISSPQNATIKQLFQLREKSRSRKKEQVFLIEGIQETLLAFKGGYEINEIYVCFAIFPLASLKQQFTAYLSSIKITEISLEVYQKLAYRTSTEGILSVAQWKNLSLEKLHIQSKNPLLLIAEAPEKPGNIGALLRTADAANIDAVIIANPQTDMYNPNIIRSSVGCVFTNKIATGSTAEIIEYLKEQNIAIYAAILQEALPYTSQNYTKPSAIVVGTEHNGLSNEWRKASNQNVIIPMCGSVDSMNVSVAAGILIFEAKRQRNS